MTNRRTGVAIALAGALLLPGSASVLSGDDDRAFEVDISKLRRSLIESETRYRSFLDRDGMSAGVYILPAGAIDRQQPHDRDEIYYVLSGRAQLVVEEDTLNVYPGAALFVAADAKHSFVNISERIELLVAFGSS